MEVRVPAAHRRSIPGRRRTRRLRDAAGSLFPPECWLLMSWSSFCRCSFCSWSSFLGGDTHTQGESVTERGAGGGEGERGAHLLLSRSSN